MAHASMRRGLHQRALGALLTLSLLEILCHDEMFAEQARPGTPPWLGDFNALGPDLRGRRIDQRACSRSIHTAKSLPAA
jgi:hypothetical protein